MGARHSAFYVLLRTCYCPPLIEYVGHVPLGTGRWIGKATSLHARAEASAQAAYPGRVAENRTHAHCLLTVRLYHLSYTTPSGPEGPGHQRLPYSSSMASSCALVCRLHSSLCTLSLRRWSIHRLQTQ
jgi:hypothetical protein